MQAVELLDLPRLPRLVRRLLVDYLTTVLKVFKPFQPVAPVIAALLRRTGARTVIDLASGGGGPWNELQPAVAAALGEPARVVLTDLHPEPGVVARYGGDGATLRFHPHSVDATAVDRTLLQGGAVRTMFDGFHHLPPPLAEAVLRDAVASGTPIVVAEVVERKLLHAIGLGLSMPVVVLLLTPFIRPRAPWRLLLTYVVPIAPLGIAWDGTISSLRAYTPEEQLALARAADPEGRFTWSVGRSKGLSRASWLVGAPRDA